MNQLRSPYSQPKEFYTNQMLRDNQPKSIAPESPGAVQGSFNRMMNIGQVGGLGGRMGELEKASMRLAEAASQRKMGEMEKEYGLRGGLLEKEIAAKAAGIGAESKASERAALESQIRELQSKGPLNFNDRARLSQLQSQLSMIR
jgi:hypothetical protein